MDEAQGPNIGQPPAATGTRLIHVSPMGNLGNRMIQYMAALSLAHRVPGARMSQIHLPEWGIQVPPVLGDYRTETVQAPVVPVDRLAIALASGAIERVDLRTYAQHIANFLPPDAYRGVFPSPSVRGAGPGELLCNIRQGDVLDARHPDYVLLPVDFYADLVERTGLAPVFMGQLEDTPYMHALRRRFPTARFVPSQGAAADFAFIRASCHIVPAISTFSWLGAWLSEAVSVHMPVLGLFNPLQARATNLLPFADARYRFILFPHHYAVPVAAHEAAHAAIRHLWRAMPATSIEAIVQRPPPPRNPMAHLAAFDEGFYLHNYPDIAAAIVGGHMPTGRHHFEHYGFAEGREPFELDAAFYVGRYPIAAIELGEGLAADPVDHWVRYGRERGYRRKK